MSENHYAEFSECSMKPQDVLEYVSGPMPVPAEGEVLIRMKAAPINPADINFVQGVYGVKPVLPHSRAGLEGCGVVQESRAEGFRKDDEVILLRGVGSWSEYVAVPAVNVMKLPVKVDPVQAAMPAHAGWVRFPDSGRLGGAERLQFRRGKVHYSTGPGDGREDGEFCKKAG